MRLDLRQRPLILIGPAELHTILVQQLQPKITGQSRIFDAGDWRHSVCEELVGLLSRPALLKLCGDFDKSQRAARRAQGDDRQSSKWELAEALVVLHDADLLAQPAIRRTLAAAMSRKMGIRIVPPGRWHPGKDAAIEFTQVLDFPPLLAGEPSPERPPPFTQISPPPNYRELADFQQEVSRALLKVLNHNEGNARALVTLPTGAGKTRVAVQTVHQWVHEYLASAGNERVSVVWLAHTEELCEQACACIQEVWQSTPGGREGVMLLRWWGDYAAGIITSRRQIQQSGDRVRVLVGTPLSYRHKLLNEPALRTALLGDLRCAIIDEAHRAAAPSYRDIIAQHGSDKVTWVGLTATPFAKEYDRKEPLAGTFALRDIFNGKLIEARKTLGPNAREELQRRGILAKPQIHTINTDTILHTPDSGASPALTLEQIDLIDRAYAEAADRHTRRLIVLKSVLGIFQSDPAARVIYTGPTVNDAEQMAFLLRREGVKSAMVSGTTLRATRRKLINEFRDGALQVLCNCEVLTTGFDAPLTTHVVVARPTVSQVLYEQMVGRGLRGAKFGGTQSCVILDCKDRQRGARPQLGYQGFREIWMPETWHGEVPISVGIRIHVRGGKTIEARRKADGQTQLTVKVPSPSRAGFHIKRVGSGLCRVQLHAVEPGSKDRLTLADVALDDAAPEFQCSAAAFAANTRLEFSAQLANAQSFIDVRPATTS